MTIKTTRYRRRDVFVEAVEVTEENMEELAEWCRGSVKKTAQGVSYIKVFVIFPKTDKQTKAFVGDRLLYSPTGFKVYTEFGFEKAFELAVDDIRGVVDTMDADTNGLGEEPMKDRYGAEVTHAEDIPDD